jgi:hypothetical protein
MSAPRAVFVAGVLSLLLAAPGAHAGSPVAAPDAQVVDVRVDRVRPEKPKYVTLRFLRENRDFLRARLDLLRLTRNEQPGGGDALDPRFLAYGQMLREALAAQDSVAGTGDAFARRALLDRIARLGDLESELDRMDSLLAGQRTRLTTLESDFTGHQETALVILVRGNPAGGAPAALTIVLEDSTVLNVPLTPAQRQALGEGGIAEVFHGFVEPREQVIEFTVARNAGPGREQGWVTLQPARDRLTFLQLDLSGLDAADPSARLRAGAWVFDADAATSAR